MDDLIPIVVTYANGHTRKAIFYLESKQLKFVEEGNHVTNKDWERRWFKRAAAHAAINVTNAGG